MVPGDIQTWAECNEPVKCSFSGVIHHIKFGDKIETQTVVTQIHGLVLKTIIEPHVQATE